jgi:hypothetical protein
VIQRKINFQDLSEVMQENIRFEILDMLASEGKEEVVGIIKI